MAETTEQRPAQGQQVVQPPDARRQQVVKLAPPRVPYHPVALEQFGVDRATWRVLVESLYPMAKTTEAVLLALAYCKARKLDIMKKCVHIVPMWNSELRREVETVWPSITEHRITAHRTNEYSGTDKTEFGPRITRHFEATVKTGKKAGELVQADVTFPEWAEVTVYRLVAGERVAFPGPRVYYLEFFGMNKGLPVPNARWARSPSQMLEKCAEAGALRKAFTEELGGEPVAEEMEDRIVEQVLAQLNLKRPEARAGAGDGFAAENEVIDVAAHVVTPAAEEDEDEAFDPETGEIGGEEERGGAKPATEAAAKPDRVAEYLAARIEDAKKADASSLAELDAHVREALKSEERPELLPQWEAAHKARAAELDTFPGDRPESAAQPSPKTPAPRTQEAGDPTYDDWKRDKYALLKNASMTRTVDDLQDEVLHDMKEPDKAAWVQACNAKAKELLAPKAKK